LDSATAALDDFGAKNNMVSLLIEETEHQSN
jgi:hypothetical protein